MEIAPSKEGILVSQRKYILDLLNETGMLGCRPIDTPMDPNKKMKTSEESAPVDKGRYQRLVEKLIYLSHTRPEIAFSISVVSQHMNNSTEDHLQAVYRILRYLKMTPGHGLLFKKCENREIEIYTDASWTGELIDKKSTTGYYSYVWRNLVTWRSKKQSVVSRSSAKSEYRALALSICEGMWLQRLLRELGAITENTTRMPSDSQAVISIAKNPVITTGQNTLR
nr:secreted RxLR effector protein 161-like [Ziziphus jujuba var. spinosa]